MKNCFLLRIISLANNFSCAFLKYHGIWRDVEKFCKLENGLTNRLKEDSGTLLTVNLVLSCNSELFKCFYLSLS